MARALRLVSGREPVDGVARRHRVAAGHRSRGRSRRLLLRRLSALRRDRGARADHGGGARFCGEQAASCSRSATDFRSLCEAGLLPGVLMRNAQLRFICRDVYLRVERSDTPFTRGYNAGQVIRVPVAHGEGNYIADGETHRAARGRGQGAVPLFVARRHDRPGLEPQRRHQRDRRHHQRRAATCSA